MYKRAPSTHKLPVHSAKSFANFSASLAMLPLTCQFERSWINFELCKGHFIGVFCTPECPKETKNVFEI
jgi:hypothetical protein